MLHLLREIAEQFQHPGQIVDIGAFGSGNINDTYLVRLDAPDEQHFILQRINSQVFHCPQQVMQNMCRLTEHVHQRLQTGSFNERRWDIPRVLRTQSGADHWSDADHSYWRAISFIQDARTFDTIQNLQHAAEIGYALGRFHDLVSDLPPEQMGDTLIGFHITPQYVQQYEQILKQTQVDLGSPEIQYCQTFICDRKAWTDVLERAKADGKLRLRLMHGDPKINNVMVDTRTGQAISLIDLDTVKPGLIHYDIGDCLRSACNPLGEETEDWQAVQFEPELARAILEGYLSQAQGFLDEMDYTYLFDAIRLITFELGLRFFTDYLAGNQYFKVQFPEHNLRRALVQFKLTESIEAQESLLRSQIEELRR